MQTTIAKSGSFDSYDKIASGIAIQASPYVYEVIFYKSDVVRIHQYQIDQEDVNPYAVVATPVDNLEIQKAETDTHLAIYSPDLRVEIEKSAISFSFYDKEGKQILANEAGMSLECQGTHKTVYHHLREDEKFIGLGEKTGPLNKRGRGYQNWNTDSFAYHEEQDPLYATIPFYMGIHAQGTYGVFLDNSYKTHFNFGASNNRFSSFSMDAGDVDYYVFSGSIENIIQSYTWLTGQMPLPPRWSLGYQQCRYSYYPEQEVMSLAKTFREKDIPADVIVLDIHYMEKYKIFTWDNERFSDPKQLIEKLKTLGFEVVVICDPGIKVEQGYSTYDTGLKEDIFLKYPDGSNYEGAVWPGWCHFPDFTKEEARNWWTEMMKTYTDIGLRGFWNDMNEIATWGQTLPENLLFSFEGQLATTRKGRNIYGMQMARSAFESAKANLKGERPFILTRAGYAGLQRYSALWTGDNVATSGHMLLGTRLISNLGLSGVSYAGYDIGGFCGDSDSRLFARWQQVATFAPFYRGHSMINSKASEPWTFGEEVEEISANYIRLRYKLMPYIYSAFEETSKTGTPIARSLAIDYTHDEKVFSGGYDNQYLFGKSILVAPIGSQDQYLKVYFPEGEWYEFFTDEKITGNQEVIREYSLEAFPLFVKASSIIPVYPNVGKNVYETGDVLEVHIYNGKEATTTSYYEDDGVTYDFKKGIYHRKKIDFDPEKRQIRFSAAEGTFESKMKQLKIIFHGFTDLAMEKLQGVSKESYAFVKPISNFDPFENHGAGKLKAENVYTLVMDYISEEITVNW